MLSSIKLKNFGPMQICVWNNLGPINLVIGKNASGKTFLLKAIYSALKSLELYRRGENQRTHQDVLFDRLYWTFQPSGKLGDLVFKRIQKGEHLSYQMTDSENHTFRYEFGKDTQKQIASIENHIGQIKSPTIFLPPKEVLSLGYIIEKSYEDQLFGFDETYLDLIRALRIKPSRGKNYEAFAQARKDLNTLLNGKVNYDESSGQWSFTNADRQTFSIHTVAEGIKKISILDTLLGNGKLEKGSVVIIDEPEANLHPEAISKFLDIIVSLAKTGVQFFMASHSYFVIKKLAMIAEEHELSIPVLKHEDQNGWVEDNFANGMPDNSIIDESIRLYEAEIERVLG